MCLVGGNEEGAGESVSMGSDGTRRAVDGGDGGVRESERVREVVEDDGRQRESEGRVVRGIGGRCDDVRARREVFEGAERGDGIVGWVVVRGFGTFAISCATYSSVSVVPIGRFST